MPAALPCSHGKTYDEAVDCDEKCADCGHDCGAHNRLTGACRAAWGQKKDGPHFGSIQFEQCFCNCQRFKASA